MVRVPAREFFEKLIDPERVLLVLEQPSAAGRESLLRMAREAGLTPEQRPGRATCAHESGPSVLRIQQDVTITLDQLELDCPGGAIWKQELTLDLASARESAAQAKKHVPLQVPQSERLLWLAGPNAVARASEAIRKLDQKHGRAALSIARLLPHSARGAQRWAVDPWAFSVQLRPDCASRELVAWLEKFARIDRQCRFADDWYEAQFTNPEQVDLYEFAARFYALAGDRATLAYHGIPLGLPLAAGGVPDDQYYRDPEQLPTIAAVNGDSAWLAVRDWLNVASHGLTPVKVFVADVGVYEGGDVWVDHRRSAYMDLPGSANTFPDTNGYRPGWLPDPNTPDPHGTEIAGLIGARWNSGAAVNIGMAGLVGPYASFSLVSLRCYTLYDIARALEYAVWCLGQDAPAKGVIVFGHDVLSKCQEAIDTAAVGDKCIFDAALKLATDHNVLVVLPAGNTPGSIPDVLRPADLSSTLIVGAAGDPRTGSGRLRWTGSRTGNGSGGPTLVAPGAKVFSTWNYPTNPSWAYDWGTSLAAAYVAGVAALVRAIAPALTASGVKSLLMTSASRLTNSSGIPLDPTEVGKGLLDGRRAVESAIASA